MRAFRIEIAGVTHHGCWIAKSEDAVEVRSAYGNVVVRDRGDPAEIARQALRRMVESRRAAPARPRRSNDMEDYAL